MDRDIERAREFFQSFDAGDGVAVLNAGEIAAQESGAFVDVALREIAFLAEGAEALTYSHL